MTAAALHISKKLQIVVKMAHKICFFIMFSGRISLCNWDHLSIDTKSERFSFFDHTRLLTSWLITLWVRDYILETNLTNLDKISAYLWSICIYHNVASGSEIPPCIITNKPLVVYRFSGICNVMNNVLYLWQNLRPRAIVHQDVHSTSG